ncbi:MAG: hypothetical protein Q9201_006135 [Fulgogasparrea decipioides]
MADPPPPPSSAAISAAFPAPPPFYKSFTPANLARLSDLQQSNPSITISELPLELHNLLPPPPPLPNNQYRIFGETHETPAPPSTDDPSKDPPNPRRLLQTTRRLLLTFLSLTNSLATDPETWAPKWDEMRALFSEANAIINEYRPHQARETLIHMMEEQVERCKTETKGCREACERVKQVVDGVERGEGFRVSDVGNQESERPTNTGKDGGSMLDAEKRMWDIIVEEVGSFR